MDEIDPERQGLFWRFPDTGSPPPIHPEVENPCSTRCSAMETEHQTGGGSGGGSW
jgi:hypothetical protein